jgi:hypothetical protein
LVLIQREKLVVPFHHVMHLAHKPVQPKSLAQDALHKVVDLDSEQVEQVQYHVLQPVVATCQQQLRLAH